MSKKSVHLPQDLIIEILLRLAVKALLRCKCVCVHKTIPASPIVFNNSNLDISLYGFAYDHSTDDYLIILASTDRRSCDYYLVSTIIYFEIFSLRANKWKLTEIDFQVILYFECDAEVGLLWNDSIHWTAYNDHTNRDVIIAFDFKESRMSEIALPYGFHGNDYNLLVLDGLISAWVVEMHMVKIWVMKKYAVHSSWTKILEFSVDHALHRSLSMVCFTNCGDIIGRDEEGGLMKFNDKGQLLEHHSRPKSIDSTYRFQMPLYTELYTESLLSLPYIVLL
ncbi:F-box/kelch-repeat protein At3g06240-like [Vicia villosa]|uniref:F-box/kelch-repeat protein At3g06240-like n=1 Tax=Vicia villosa TaxID=3911 RepID=UPI00273CC6AA|nr:F-box/kelch-repeat protein At3g06240-like [Vicia villosa]